MRDSLFLCHRLPFPPNKGDKIRSFAILRHLASRGRVRVGCFVDEAGDRQYRKDVTELAGGDCYFEDLLRPAKIRRSLSALVTGRSISESCFYSAAMQAWVDRMLAGHDIADVVVFGSVMAPYIERARSGAAAAVLDMVDVDSDKWVQYARKTSAPMKWLYAREARTLEKLERRAAQRFGKTFLCSPFEAETFRALAPESVSKIGYFGNGVSADFFQAPVFPSPFSPGQVPVVMTGRMDYRPNSQGAIWFAEQVMPRVLKTVPHAHAYFVGAGAPAALQRVAGPHVTVTGTVADIRPYIQHAGVIVAPLLIARGVQNKVLEAMAMAKPIVATREATRALAVEAGKHLWVENDPVRFAGAVIEAAAGPEGSGMAARALDFVKEHHNWDVTLKTLDTALDDLRAGPSTLHKAPHVQAAEAFQADGIPRQAWQ